MKTLQFSANFRTHTVPPPGLRDQAVRWWLSSVARTLAGEAHRFLIRIAYILRNPTLRRGEYQMGSTLRLEGEECLFDQPNSYLRANIAYIEQQKLAQRWAGPLDLQTIAHAYQAGAQWGRDSIGIQIESGIHHEP